MKKPDTMIKVKETRGKGLHKGSNPRKGVGIYLGVFPSNLLKQEGTGSLMTCSGRAGLRSIISVWEHPMNKIKVL